VRRVQRKVKVRDVMENRTVLTIDIEVTGLEQIKEAVDVKARLIEHLPVDLINRIEGIEVSNEKIIIVFSPSTPPVEKNEF
ncbi:hypothetical protein, partial [Anaerorhabdus sp.]|uniref:hypothetical protein n=1 Tax=Anaerorhabdus sp. TaxID=1872524 RepID=UPI002FC6AFA9